MKRPLSKGTLLLLISIAGLFLVMGSFQIAGQSRPPQRAAADKPIPSPSKYSGPLPKAEFGRAPAETAAQQIHRQSRENRHRNFFPFISDPGKLVEGSQETARITIIDTVYVQTSEQFPMSLSSAVLVGTVMNSQGFVSQDRTCVYSDFEIRVDEILKQDRKTSLALGQFVTVSRFGATVHFPSGHVKRFLLMGQGMPKIGSQYVLFLWRPVPELPEYEILRGAAFELADGIVHPLDENYTSSEGIDATSLLAEIRKAVGASKD